VRGSDGAKDRWGCRGDGLKYNSNHIRLPRFVCTPFARRFVLRRRVEGNLGRRKEIVETEGYELPRFEQEGDWKDKGDREVDERFVREAREAVEGGGTGESDRPLTS